MSGYYPEHGNSPRGSSVDFDVCPVGTLAELECLRAEVAQHRASAVLMAERALDVAARACEYHRNWVTARNYIRAIDVRALLGVEP